MHLSQIRRVLVTVAAFAVSALIVPVHAAGIQATGLQILDPSGACDHWEWGGTAQAPTVACVPPGPATTGTPVCSITANGSNPLNINATTQVALHVVCTNTDSTTTYAWTGTGVQSATQGFSPQDQSVSVSGSTTFSVTATTGALTSTSKSVTVTLTPPGTDPGTKVSCSAQGFKNTIILNLDYPSDSQFTTTAFGNSDIVVATFKTPLGMTAADSTGLVNVIEYNGSPAVRTVAVNTAPCDFTKNAERTNFVSDQQRPNIYFSSNPANGVLLQPDTRYYVNVSNKSSRGGGTCPTTNCGVMVILKH